MRLAQLQRAFQAHVLSGSNAIGAHVAPARGAETAMRLAVYAEGYDARLVEALAVTYPALERALGQERFADCVRALVHRRPSRFFSVRRYGRELAELLEGELPGARGRGAAELARFEWALAEAFDAADARPLAAQDLEHIDPSRWAGLRFELVPGSQTLSLATNAVCWWQAAAHDRAPPARWRAGRSSMWLIWRRELAVYFRRLAQEEARALAALRSGASFGALCAQLARCAPAASASLRAATLLKRWLGEGILVAPGAGLSRRARLRPRP